MCTFFICVLLLSVSIFARGNIIVPFVFCKCNLNEIFSTLSPDVFLFPQNIKSPYFLYRVHLNISSTARTYLQPYRKIGLFCSSRPYRSCFDDKKVKILQTIVYYFLFYICSNLLLFNAFANPFHSFSNASSFRSGTCLNLPRAIFNSGQA